MIKDNYDKDRIPEVNFWYFIFLGIIKSLEYRSTNQITTNYSIRIIYNINNRMLN